MQIIPKFTYESVRFDRDNDIHLVTTLKAPKQDTKTKRPTVCITVALDVSGSMSGPKIDYARKTLTKLLDHLQPGDYVGLVTFDTQVETIFATHEFTLTQKADLQSKVSKLRDKSSTNLSGGLLSALEMANKMDLPAGAVNRVIVLTDGHPNAGIAQRAEELTSILSANLGTATVSFFGYGNDTNHELLGTMARLGKGNYAFIKNPDDAVTAFATELGGLLSTYAQDIRISIEPQNGHSITEVVSDVDADGEDEKVTVKIPDLLSEEERHIVFSVKLAKQKKTLPRITTAFNINVTYTFLDENGKKQEKTEAVKAQVHLVKPGEEQAKATLTVDQIVGIAELVKRQVEADAAAARGDYKGAQSIFEAASASFGLRDLGVVVSLSNNASANYRAENFEKSAGLRSALRSSGTRGMGTSSADAEVQSYYAGTGVVMSNSLQDSTSKSFGGGGGAVAQNVVSIVGHGGGGGGGGVSTNSASPIHLTTPVEPIKAEAPESKEKSDEKSKKIAKKRSAKSW